MLQQLETAIQAQSAAVQKGDPAAIAAASRNLNAQIYSLLAELKLAQGKPQDAEAFYQESYRLEPSTDRRLEFASVLLGFRDNTGALSQADAVLANDPSNIPALMTRGSALRALGKNEDALNSLSHALQLRSDPNVAFALGSTYLSLGQKSKADDIFRRLIESSGRNPTWYVAVGDAYRNANDTSEAIAHLKTALSLDPKVAHGEFFLGLTDLQANQWGPNPESVLHLQRAVEQNPKEYISNFYLGALESTAGSDLAASDRHLHAAAEADPTQPEVWLYLGLNANREKNTAAAKGYFQKAIDVTGADEGRNNYQIRKAYFALGRILVAEGNRQGGEELLARYKRAQLAAVAESGKSISQGGSEGMSQPSLADISSAAPTAPDPGAQPSPAAITTADRSAQEAAESKLAVLLASSYNDLGTAEARQHDFDAALADFQQSERWDPSRPLTLRNLGTAAFRVNNSAEAARALALYQEKQKAAGQPVDAHASLLLAMSQFALGNFAGASGNFASAGQATLADPTTAYSYAFALARTGSAQESNKLALALETQSLPQDLLPLVCHLFIDTEDYKDSQTCYRKALRADPNLALAHYEIGESLIHLDQPSEAIPELRTELERNPGNPNVSTALAYALMQTSQKDQARKLLMATVQAHPEHAEAQYQYGKLLLEDGNVQDSITHLEASEHANDSKDYVHYQLGTAYRKSGRTADAEREFKLYRQIKDKNRDANAVPH